MIDASEPKWENEQETKRHFRALNYPFARSVVQDIMRFGTGNHVETRGASKPRANFVQ